MTADGQPAQDREVPLRVHDCNRVGTRANPPGRRLVIAGWLRRR